MKKSIAIIAVLVSALAFSSTVFAKKEQALKYDMQDLSCKELIEMDEETMGIMLMWLDGYLSGVTGDTKFDSDQSNFDRSWRNRRISIAISAVQI